MTGLPNKTSTCLKCNWPTEIAEAKLQKDLMGEQKIVSKTDEQVWSKRQKKSGLIKLMSCHVC